MQMSAGTSSLLRSVSSQKLQLCILVLSEMRDNYWGAEAIYRLFRQAEAMMRDRPDQNQHASSIADNAKTGTGTRQYGNHNHQTPDEVPLGAPQLQCLETQPASQEYLFDEDNSFIDPSGLDFLLDFDGPDIFGMASALSGTYK